MEDEMSGLRPPNKTPLGFLLLRDGHVVPLSGISPEEIKAGAIGCFRNSGVDRLRHRATLNAIVDRLGFDGDFGTFTTLGWPKFQEFLRKENCLESGRLFPSDHGGCIDLYFGATTGASRRQLTDRVFESKKDAPSRVFLGYGVDWAAWDNGMGFYPPEGISSVVGGDPATAEDRARRLFAHRHDLSGQWGFADDKLVWGSVGNIINKTYFTLGTSIEHREESWRKVKDAVLAFRAVFDTAPEGWVDILHYNDRLVVLRAHDGTWDILWRAYRNQDPEESGEVPSWIKLSGEDMPTSLRSKGDNSRLLYFRQNVWDEVEEHVAEQAFYDRGGSIVGRQLASFADVRIAWLRDTQQISIPRKHCKAEELPKGFCVVEVSGRRLAISELVDVSSYRAMLDKTGYLDRRSGSEEALERANDNVPGKKPVGSSWFDAQAYCAWKERQLGLSVRLPSRDELRAIHPIFSDHYEAMCGGDFPWEKYPPRPRFDESVDGSRVRQDLPSAVEWSEPRFLEPGPDLPEFPEDGWSSKSRKRWISDFPPRALWRKDLKVIIYSGVGFIDAWDACEWCQEAGWAHGRFWDGPIGPASWGAYKNMKMAFRLVIELEG